MAHIVVIGTNPGSLANFRGPLIRAMVDNGHQVTAMATGATEQHIARVKALGADYIDYDVHRSGLNPLRDLATFFNLRRVFRELQPDIVLAYTAKPVIWGGLALRSISRRVRFYASITGLGFALQSGGLRRRLLSSLVAGLYKLAVGSVGAVIFQNPDDARVFVDRRIVGRDRVRLVNGSGIDLDRFQVQPGPDNAALEFLMIARLLREKGVLEFVEAARLTRNKFPDTVFRLVGPKDPSPDGIPASEIASWEAKGVVDYKGPTSDVRPFIADSDVYVLPSFCGEGVPRSVLEAMSVGRPILTTDNVGCRETVIPGENGFLVPVRDAQALAERMIWFIENRHELDRMGRASRALAEDRFDVHKVNAAMLSVMGLDGDAEGAA